MDSDKDDDGSNSQEPSPEAGAAAYVSGQRNIQLLTSTPEQAERSVHFERRVWTTSEIRQFALGPDAGAISVSTDPSESRYARRRTVEFIQSEQDNSGSLDCTDSPSTSLRTRRVIHKKQIFVRKDVHESDGNVSTHKVSVDWDCSAPRESCFQLDPHYASDSSRPNLTPLQLHTQRLLGSTNPDVTIETTYGDDPVARERNVYETNASIVFQPNADTPKRKRIAFVKEGRIPGKETSITETQVADGNRYQQTLQDNKPNLRPELDSSSTDSNREGSAELNTPENVWYSEFLNHSLHIMSVGRFARSNSQYDNHIKEIRGESTKHSEFIYSFILF